MDNESIDLAAMLAYELQDASTKARLLARIAARCASSGRKVDAIRYAKEAMSLAEADNSPLQKVLVAADAAHVYFLCENRDIALRTLLWAVDAVSQLDLRVSRTAALLGIAEVYETWSIYDNTSKFLAQITERSLKDAFLASLVSKAVERGDVVRACELALCNDTSEECKRLLAEVALGCAESSVDCNRREAVFQAIHQHLSQRGHHGLGKRDQIPPATP